MKSISESEGLGSVYEPLMRVIESDTLAYRVVFAKTLKSPVAAIVLSQYLYWGRNKKSVERGGWFYKTEAEFYEETGVSGKSQRTARDILIKYKLLVVEKRGVPAKNWYKINYTELAQFIFENACPSPVWGEQEDTDGDNKYSPSGTTGSADRGVLPITENTTHSARENFRPSDRERMKDIATASDYEPDGFSPRVRLQMKRRIEKALGLTRSSKWSQLLFGAAWDFLTAFEHYEGYQYPDTILLDEVAKTLASWYERGETRETIRDMLTAFFESDKGKKVTITPNSVFSSHTYNSWKQNKL